VAKNPPGGAQRFSRGSNPNDNSVQRTRAWSGFCVVFAGDMAIVAAAIFTVWKFSRSGGGGDTTPIVAVLTSAFTAVSTMTTAYFGIKTMSNTAQSFAPAATAAANSNNPPPGGTPPAADASTPPGRVPPPGPPPPARGLAPSGPPPPARGPAPAAGAARPVPAAAPVPADPANPTDAEIVARTQEPPQ
jgi:hypothetical protein